MVRLLAFVTLFLCATLSRAEIDGTSNYPLGVGDLISIQVFGEDDLSMEVRLNDAGTISYPFLGEIRARGLTISQLSDLITRQLADGYLVSPNVNVTVGEYRQFFIYGEVKSPGGYPYQPSLNLQKAVALAGGFSERASSSKFYVSREGKEDGRGQKAGLNTAINPGDIITIEESFF